MGVENQRFSHFPPNVLAGAMSRETMAVRHGLVYAAVRDKTEGATRAQK